MLLTVALSRANSLNSGAISYPGTITDELMQGITIISGFTDSYRLDVSWHIIFLLLKSFMKLIIRVHYHPQKTHAPEMKISPNHKII